MLYTFWKCYCDEAIILYHTADGNIDIICTMFVDATYSQCIAPTTATHIQNSTMGQGMVRQ